MNREIIEKLLDEAAEEIRVAAHELIDHIQDAERAALEASQETDGAKAKISIGAKISIDLGANAFKVTVSVPVMHKVEGDIIQIGGPRQMDMFAPLKNLQEIAAKHGGTVSVHINDTEV